MATILFAVRPEADLQPTLVNATALSKQYDSVEPALAGIDLVVRPGEVYCLLGGSRSGKTTLLAVLLGLVRPTAGRVTVAGHDPTRAPIETRRAVSFVGRQQSLCNSMSTVDNVRFFQGVSEPTSQATQDECRNALRTMGVPERLFDSKPRSLSGEQIIAVWLSIALLRQSPVVLLDDPTAGLDSRAVAAFQECLATLRNRGCAVLLATSDVLLASQVADRIGILKRGRKLTERTRAEVLGLSLTELYLDYVGRNPGFAAVDRALPLQSLVP